MSDPLLSPEQAQQLVLQDIPVLGVERVPLFDALGRVLAEGIAARHDNPPQDNSAMDGYALRHADIAGASAGQPVLLEVVEDIPAGYVPRKSVGPGQASRIMTGALVPEGADTVVRVEDTRAEGKKAAVLVPPAVGANIRRRGEDVRAGQEVVPAGSPVTPGALALLASLQRALVPVHRQPVVAILSTGDELVEVDEPLAPGKIVNSNTYGLAALCLANGALPLMLPIARDEEAQIRRAVESALSADFILSSGGVSVGDYDYVKKVLDDLGAQARLWRVAMKPGKPLFFCVLQGKPYFGLPGNPVSSLVSFLQFVRPALRKAAGHLPGTWFLPQVAARLEHDLFNDGDRRQYVRARLRLEEGRLLAAAPQGQGSHQLSSMLGTNGLLLLEAGMRLGAGDEVQAQVFGDL
ncbi:MAG: molybdopterin molybdotransferase MoeA [Candidatus Latescibacteria bacterium]|nr:molybdopterin molybdotransferase MoeA [Candidatus Latescibacterota bacterium]